VCFEPATAVFSWHDTARLLRLSVKRVAVVGSLGANFSLIIRISRLILWIFSNSVSALKVMRRYYEGRVGAEWAGGSLGVF
jgi:hypothetical protein